jgi:hypothetical protein
MSALTIIRDIMAIGGNLRLIDGGLKVSAPPGKVSTSMLKKLKEHKPEILAALLMGGNKLPGGDQGLDSERAILRCQIGEHLKSKLAPKGVGGKFDGQKNEPPKLGTARNCQLCGRPLNHDGGDCWHKAFHVGDQSAKLRTPDPAPNLDAGASSPESEKAAAAPRLNDQAPGILPQAPERINIVALSWLRENRQGLKAAGWPANQLWRRNKSRGIAWMSIWGMPGLSVAIQSDGCICFHFLDNGKQIKQTAWPQGKLKSKRRIAS